MTDDRFKLRQADSPSDEDMAVLQEIAARIDTTLMFLDPENGSLLQRLAQEADVDPDAWLIRALNLQADVHAGRLSVTHPRTETILPLGEWYEPTP